MSNTVDNRVVSMEFDNKNFEKNVATSMSTLDKLKQKLKFKGAGDGLEKISSSANKISFSGLSNGIQTVQAKFSALEVVGVTALANITKSAIDAGTNLAKSFTLDPVIQGFQEYETQMGAIQTILANTESKGSTLEDVKAALDELNTYADQTIYNFTEMTRNIGTFTAAGVDLDKSVTAIKGIANLAAISGSTSTQASTAMYQLSQALAAGRVSLMDWNSVVNAGMGGEVFQTALKRTATQMGKDVDGMIEKYGSFRESLTEGGWLTAEVLTETLTQISGAYSEADLIAQGYTEDQAKAIRDLADTAVSAATEVKTFTGLMDTVKEAIGSGWAKTWQLLIGDFDESKELFTGISNVISGFVNETSDARNNLLEGALSSNWDKLIKKVNEAGVETDAFEDKIRSTAEAYGIVDLDKIIEDHGSLKKAFQEGALSSDILKTAVDNLNNSLTDLSSIEGILKKGSTGEDVSKVQEALKNLGYDLGEFGEKADGIDGIIGSTTENAIKAFQEASGLSVDGIIGPDTIAALEQASATTEKTVEGVDDLISAITDMSGREMIIDSLKNAFEGLMSVIKPIKDAFREVFPPMTVEQLTNLINKVHEFSEGLGISDSTADKLQRTFKGLFTALKLVASISGGGLKLAFSGLSAILGFFDKDILDVTASLGDAIVKFDDFVSQNDLIAKAIEKIRGYGAELATVFDGITLDNLPDKILDGLSKIPEKLSEIKDDIQKTITDLFDGLFSSNTSEVDVPIMGNLSNDFEKGSSTILKNAESFKDSFLDIFENIDLGTVFAGGVTIGLMAFAKKLINILDNITSPLQSFNDILEGFGKMMSKSFPKMLKAFAFNVRMEGVKQFAEAVAILVGSIAVLTFLDSSKVNQAVVTVATLAIMLTALSLVVNQLSSASVEINKNGANIAGLKPSLAGIGAAILMLAASVKLIGSMNPDEAIQGFKGLTTLMVEMGVFAVAYGKLANGDVSKDIDKLGKMMQRMAKSMLLIIAVMKLVSMLSEDELTTGTSFMLAFGLFVTAMGYVSSKTGENVDKLGTTMIKMAVAMGLMAITVRLIGALDPWALVRGALFAAAFLVFIKALTVVTKNATDMPKIAGTLIGISVAIGTMAIVARLVGGMDLGVLIKGVAAVTAFGLIVKSLVKSLSSLGSNSPKIASTLLAMSVSIGIMAGIAALLSVIDVGALAKGVTVVGILGLLMSIMVYSTKNATQATGSIIALSVAIGLMAAAVAGLSLIEPGNLAGATAALVALMAMFALLANATSNVKTSYGTLAAMLVTVGVLSLVLAGISKLPVESTLSNATALSELMLALTAMTAALSKIGGGGVGSIKAAVAGAAALDAVIVIVGGLIAGLGALDEYLLDGGLATSLDSGIAILEKVGYGLGSFVSSIGEGLTSKLPDIGANISGFAENLQGFLAIDFGTDSISGFVSFIESMGSIVKNEILDSIFEFFTGESTFDSFGGKIKEFAESLKGVGQAFKEAGLDDASVQAAAKAGAMMASLADVIPKEGGFLQDLMGTANLGNFGTQMADFAEGLGKFSTGVKEAEIDADAVTAAKNAGEMMAALADIVPKSGGMLQRIMGASDLGNFGKQMEDFGEGVSKFSKSVSGENAVNEDAVTAAKNAGEIMVALTKEIPETGGFLQAFTGTSDLEDFGEKMVAFGKSMANYSTAVEGISTDKIELASAISSSIVELAEELVGVEDWYQGAEMLTQFTGKLKEFGGVFYAYYENIKDIEPSIIDSVMASLQGFYTLAQGTGGEGIDTSGLEAFVKSLGTLATGELTTFVQSMTSISGDLIMAASSISALKDLMNELASVETSGISVFSTGVSDLQSAITRYSSGASGTDYASIGSSMNVVRQLAQLISSLAGLDTSGVDTLSSAVDKLGSMDVSKIASAFSGSTSQMSSVGTDMMNSLTSGLASGSAEATSAATSAVDGMLNGINGKISSFSRAGSESMVALVNGVKSQSSAAPAAIMSAMNQCVSTANGYYGSFYGSGSYVGSGLAAGISSQVGAVQSAAAALAAAAEAATRAKLQINSPSKVFREIGKGIPEGMAQGVTRFASLVTRSVDTLSTRAIDGSQTALSHMSAIMSSDMDYQPTIRPVVDLSAVRSGVGEMNSMLNSSRPSVDVLANLESTSRAMRDYRQNGGNPDVVSAINKLRKDIGNMPRNQYNLGGITYDDGSNISEAVQTLVRAVLMEGRA